MLSYICMETVKTALTRQEGCILILCFFELCLSLTITCVRTVHLRNQFTNNGISFGVLLSSYSSAKNLLMNLLTAIIFHEPYYLVGLKLRLFIS